MCRTASEVLLDVPATGRASDCTLRAPPAATLIRTVFSCFLGGAAVFPNGVSRAGGSEAVSGVEA